MGRIARGVLVGLLAICSGLAISPTYAVTIDEPESMTIDSVRAYDGVINTDDLLIVAQYNIQYSDLPVLAVTDAYIGRFLVDDSEVNAVEIIAFNDIGYGIGIFSLYFTAAEKSTASIEFNNPNAEDYKVVLQGKPSAFVDPPVIQTSTITYRPDSNSAKNLLTDAADLAELLENNAAWLANGLDLITFTSGQQVLTVTGEAYFGLAVPNLQIMIPDLFGSSTTSPAVFERQFGTSEQDRLLGLWDASPMGPIFTGLADSLQLSKSWILGLIGLAIVVGAVWLASTFTDPEYGLLTIPFTWPLMIAAGLGSLSALMFTVAIAVIGLFYVLFLRRAG